MTRKKSLNARSIAMSAFALTMALLLGTAFSSAAQAQTSAQNPAGNGQQEGDTATSNADDNVGNNTSISDNQENNVTVSVVPFVQAPGASVLVIAEGLSPNSNATITLSNVMIERESNQTGEGNSNQTDLAATQASEDDRGFTSIVAGRTLTDENGTLLFALGIPKEDVVVETTITDNSTGQETTITDTLALQGTLQVVVKDQRGNTGQGEVTVLAPINNARANGTGGDSNSSNTGIQ